MTQKRKEVAEQALRVAKKAGASYTDVPFLRTPNVSLDPDPKGPSLKDLIADTSDEILIDGYGSYSIDQQRNNFQFSGDAFREIKKGKIAVC